MTGSAAGPALIDDGRLDDVLGAARGMLILTRTDCRPCAAYRADVATLRAQGRLDGITVGSLVLDRPGGARFKQGNPWLADLRYLPHTVLYRRGRPVDAFAASRGDYLLERIAAAFGPTPERADS